MKRARETGKMREIQREMRKRLRGRERESVWMNVWEREREYERENESMIGQTIYHLSKERKTKYRGGIPAERERERDVNFEKELRNFWQIRERILFWLET